MKDQLEKIKQLAEQELDKCENLEVLENLRVKFLGKKGELTAILKQMGSLSAEERPVVGQLANTVRSAIEEDIAKRTQALKEELAKKRLENALADYDGTMLIVSHDRYFIDKLADKIYYLDNSGMTLYNGNYSYFTEKFKNSEATEVKEKKQTAAAVDYREQKRIESEKRKKQTKIKKTEDEIAQLEEKITELNERLQSPEVSADYEKAMEISDELAQLNASLEEKYGLWEELQAE